MKVNEQPRLHQSTVEAEAIRMTIDMDATPHIMDVLTKQYGNPLLAVIREYATNAWDANVEVGCTNPIRVTLPTRLAPNYSVEDDGVGLDVDDIRDIYSKFGASTKRNTNDQNGMLGLGCKSALAYTSQFTVESVKDGTRTVVLVSRDEDGGASMTPVSVTATTDGNGTKVTIPVKASDIRAASELAYRFFRFWPTEQVRVNGKTVDCARDLGGIWLTDNILLTDHADVGEDLVVMGNVPYPLVDGTDALFAHYRWSAVCFVPIGAVNFAPSRESLMTTKQTTHTLDKLRTKIEAEFERSVREQIENAASAKEAQDLLTKGKSMGFKGTATYKGREVVLSLIRKAPTRIEKDWRGQDTEAPILSGTPDDWTVEDALKYSYLHTSENYSSRKTGERSQTIRLNVADQWIFEGFDGKSMTNVKRAKLELWFQQHAATFITNAWNGTQLPHCVFVDKLTPDERFWTTGWQRHNWADVDAIVLPKTTMPDGTKTRLKGSYDALIKGELKDGVAANTIAAESKNLDLYWTHGNKWNLSRHRAFKSGALDSAKCTAVALGQNRIEKFKRDFPQAKNLDAAAKEAAERWTQKQSVDIRKACAVQRRSNIDLLKMLDANDLSDPDLVKLHKLATTDTSTYSAEKQAFAYWVDVDESDFRKTSDWADAVLAGYPLYGSIGRYDRPDPKHVTLYLNAVYEARQKGGI